ncbi:NERD domain-containing protein [Psychrobacillus antarcticus]|uniref:NERD domain-containing protein n=1 Tax=Psychrobacillus antarcticus TaxID=2879115 RepID=UPI002407C86E|nr:NERD domain-containing protein [Psychrobacillus antarcticus]
MTGFAKKSFLERVKLALKDKEELRVPVLIKEGSSAQKTIEKIQSDLENEKVSETQKDLQSKIKIFELGLYGEKSVQFELMNAFIPIHILHDLQLKHGEWKAQIDFVVITRKFILVIEVKNYYGNIQVTEHGDFIRNVMKGKKVVFQEGFYSPIRQIERQTEVLRTLLMENGIIGNKTPIKQVVVFTNNKTILDMKKTKEDIRDRIVRVDGLVGYISNELKKSSPVQILDNRMSDISGFLLNSHIEEEIEKTDDTVELKLLGETVEAMENPLVEQSPTVSGLEEALRTFRKEKAAVLGMKAFHIFSNQTLDEIVSKQPTTFIELLTIKGIGEKKIEEYGREIIEVIQRQVSRG